MAVASNHDAAVILWPLTSLVGCDVVIQALPLRRLEQQVPFILAASFERSEIAISSRAGHPDSGGQRLEQGEIPDAQPIFIGLKKYFLKT